MILKALNSGAYLIRSFLPSGLVALHEYGKESLNDLDAAVSSQSDASIEAMFRHNVLVWELLVALWGSLPEFENVDGKSN